MQCSQCHAENRDGRRFCAECGVPLAIVCPDCAFTNDLGEKFCGGCGKALAVAASASAAKTKSLRAESKSPLPTRNSGPAGVHESVATEAERRQLTVMFCDLVGSTALSQQLDPEDLRNVFDSYQQAAGEVIDRYDGFIAKYMGDGMLVYFGYPRAHEDDAERAIHSGLEIIATMKELNTSRSHEKGGELAVRIGIATGLVVVGKGASEDAAIVGETPNLAARLQTIANANTVVIGESTRDLAGGMFEYATAGTHDLKGYVKPVQVWRVVQKSTAKSRFEATVKRGLMPLVGREEEIALLLKRWTQAKDGESQVVLLAGEAGIGKSRIVRAFRDRVLDEPHNRILYYGSPYHQNSAFYPAIDQIERAMRFDKDDSPAQKLNKIEAVLDDLSLSKAELAPLLASLLSLPTNDRYPPVLFGPEQIKKDIIDALVTIIETMASRNPVIMVIEDAQWVDPSTLELIDLVIEKLRSSRFLLVITSRPEFEARWGGSVQPTLLTLNRMSRKEIIGMVEEVTRGKVLPDAVLNHIITKTDGVPLFVEELTKTVLESDLLQDIGERYVLLDSLPELPIPASLQDSLMARLDRLATVREVAQLAATVGRNFNFELLAAVSPLGDRELRDALAQLLEAELIYHRGLPADEEYVFKHLMVQEVAYQTLLKTTRQRYHARIAKALLEQFPQTVENQPEVLAHHYTEAHLAKEAIGYWQQAGQKAVASSANLEAIGHLNQGLKLLNTLPDTPERVEQELKLQLTLAVPLTATSGYAAPEVEHAYKRARQLSQQMGQTPQLFPALYGLWRYRCLRAEYKTALELGKELLKLAQDLQDTAFVMASHRTLGATFFYLGELSDSRAHLAQVIDNLSRDQSSPTQLIQEAYDVIDPRVASRSYMSWVLWLFGYADQARQASREVVALAQTLAHPFSMALALSFAAWLHQFCREEQQTRECAEAAILLAREQGFPFWVGWGEVLRGWAQPQLGQDYEEIVAQMKQGVVNWRAQGSELGTAYFHTLLADVHRKQRQTEEGLDAVADAQAFTRKTNERFLETEQFRLKGELLLQRNDASTVEPESCFRQALDVARHQQAKSLELRAATSLARLWSEQGKRTEAYELLAPIYGWFTEGFDTQDLGDAKTLLKRLA